MPKIMVEGEMVLAGEYRQAVGQMDRCYQMYYLPATLLINMIFFFFLLCNRFPSEKLHMLDSEQDAILVLRSIGSQKLRKISLRDYRPHLIAESISYELNSEQVNITYFVSN